MAKADVAGVLHDGLENARSFLDGLLRIAGLCGEAEKTSIMRRETRE